MEPKGKLRLELVIGDDIVLDEVGAKLLLLIDRTGSIMSASKLMGIPYSSAWDYIARIENILKTRIVRKRRGGPRGGGTELTEAGRRLLEKYLSEYRKFFGKSLEVEAPLDVAEREVLIYAGSHDIALEHLFGMLRERDIDVETHWIGSLKGLASLLLNEALLCGIHLFDEDTSTYNVPYVRKMLGGKYLIISGYERLQGVVVRERMSLNEILNGLLRGKLKFVNRVYGSGTRLLIDSILRKRAYELGINYDKIHEVVRGYEKEVNTHLEVAQYVAQGLADVGIAIEWAARAYGLYFIPLRWERFDFVILADNLSKTQIRSFISMLRSERFLKLLRSLPGYKFYPSQIGSLIAV